MATPYTESGEVDLASMERLVDYLIDNGAHVMSPNGGDSEAPYLSIVERNTVVDVVVRANDGRTPVLVGTSAHTVAETLELNRHAQEAGAVRRSADRMESHAAPRVLALAHRR